MPTLDTLQLPRIDAGAYGGREAKKIVSHLYQVEEQLRYVLGHLDEDNLAEGLKSKIESGGMSSEILQTLDAITLRVSGQDDAMAELRVSLTGISATVQEQGGHISTLQQTAESITATVAKNQEDAVSMIQQTAKDITASVSKTYATKTELSSEIKQSAESITATVSRTYATKTEVSSQIKQTAESIKLSVTNGATGSSFTLKAGETTLSSGTITFTGLVNFVSKGDLLTAGSTTINGSNITTGTLSADLIKSGVILSSNSSTRYDLDSGTIQMGADGSPHIYLDNQMIRWYVALPGGGVGPTGVIRNIYGESWVGATSQRTRFGWISENADSYYGMEVSNGGNAHFNVDKVECNGAHDNGQGTFEANKLVANYMEARISKPRIVDTQDYGIVAMEAMESPIPVFCDSGNGMLDGTGTCRLYLHPKYIQTVAANTKPQWFASADPPVSVRNEGLSAVVRGEPGTEFSWLCIFAQKGREGLYARSVDVSRAEYAGAKDHIADRALQAAARDVTARDGLLLAVAQENERIETIFPKEVFA